MMRKILLLAALCVTLAANAQENEQRDSVNQEREVYIIEDRFHDPARRFGNVAERQVTVTLNKLAPKKKTDNSKRLGWRDGHWAGVVLSYNGLIGDLGNFSLPDDAEFLSQSPKSIGVSVNLIDYMLGISRKVGFVTGLGFEFNNFRFDNNIGLKRVNGVTVADNQYNERGIHLEKSKLVTCYMNIPILFEVQLGRHNDFFINGGVIGGWRMSAHTKIKANTSELKGKYKNHDNLGLHNLHYGYTLNFGYDHFAISTVYYPQSIFRKGQGPQVQQFNIGLTLLM